MRARLLAEQDPNDTGFSLIYKNPTLWDYTFVGGKPIDYTPPVERSIAEIARQRGESPWATAYDFLLKENGRAFLTHFGVGYANRTPAALHAMMRHPLSVLGLSDAGAHGRLIVDAGIHTYMLTRWARDTAADDEFHLPVEKVVHMLTQRNADLFGARDRGSITTGRRADINLINLDKLCGHVPYMTYDLPAGMPRLTQDVDGYVATLVHGEVVQENGTLTGTRPGRVMRGSA
jgi:N-acyl-D-aspartate/D-glutamate deacylase